MFGNFVRRDLTGRAKKKISKGNMVRVRVSSHPLYGYDEGAGEKETLCKPKVVCGGCTFAFIFDGALFTHVIDDGAPWRRCFRSEQPYRDSWQGLFHFGGLDA